MPPKIPVEEIRALFLIGVIVILSHPLIRPYFLAGVALGGVPLDSHDVVFSRGTMAKGKVQTKNTWKCCW